MMQETVFISLPITQLQAIIVDCVNACLDVRGAVNSQPVTKTSTATRQQAAEYLNISLPTLGELTKTGKVKGKRLGKRVLYHWSDLEAALTTIKTKEVANA